MNSTEKSLYNGFYFVKIRQLLRFCVNSWVCAPAAANRWVTSATFGLHNVQHEGLNHTLTSSIMVVKPQGKGRCHCHIAFNINMKSNSFQNLYLYFNSLPESNVFVS